MENSILTANGLSTIGSPNGLSSKPDIFHAYFRTESLVSDAEAAVWSENALFLGENGHFSLFEQFSNLYNNRHLAEVPLSKNKKLYDTFYFYVS